MRSSSKEVGRRVLPEAAEAAGVEEGFVAEEREIFGLSLGDEHSMERVLVRTGKESGANAVLDGNGKELKSFALKMACEICPQAGCRGKFAEADFGGKLPSRGGADDEDVLGFRDAFTGRTRQPRLIGDPPKYGAGVQERSHVDLFPGAKFFSR